MKYRQKAAYTWVYAELSWGRGSKLLKIAPGGGFGKGCTFYIYFWEGEGPGQPGNPSGYTLVVGRQNPNFSYVGVCKILWPFCLSV